MDKIKRNFYLYTFFSSLRFAWSVFMLYFANQWLNTAQIWILLLLWFWVPSFFEIPSSILADKFSRKNILIIGAVVDVLSMIFYIIWWDFYIFVLAILFQWISVAFCSGTNSAWLYDSLADCQKDWEYDKIASKSMSFYFFGRAIACIVWWVSYAFSVKFPFILTLINNVLILLLLIVFFKESNHKKSTAKFYLHIKEWVSNLAKSKFIKNILIYIILTVSGNMIFFYFQPVLEFKWLPVVRFGVVYMVMNIFSALWAHYYKKFEFISKRLLIIGLIVFALVTLVYIKLDYWFMFLASSFSFFIAGMQMTYMTTLVNKSVSSNIRATALSLVWQLFSLTLWLYLFICWLLFQQFWLLNWLYINIIVIVIWLIFWARAFMGENKHKEYM